eukprot:6443764-Amphidinium_carterae.3
MILVHRLLTDGETLLMLSAENVTSPMKMHLRSLNQLLRALLPDARWHALMLMKHHNYTWNGDVSLHAPAYLITSSSSLVRMCTSSSIRGLPAFFEVQNRITAFDPTLPFRLACDCRHGAVSIVMLTSALSYQVYLDHGTLRALGFPADLAVSFRGQSLQVVAGGMRATNGSESSRLNLLAEFKKERNLPVLAVSSSSCDDPLFDCLSGFLHALIPNIPVHRLYGSTCGP